MPRRFLFLLGLITLLAFQKTEAQNVVFDTVGNTIITADTVVKETKNAKPERTKKLNRRTKAAIMSACLP